MKEKMYNGNQAKADLLGEPFGTANNKLRKIILFDFAWRLGLQGCYRCGENIEDIAQFSIEHKDAWMSALNPRAAFFNLDNIAFSHTNCNVKAGTGRTRNPLPLQERRKLEYEKWYSKPDKREKHLQRKRDKYQENKLRG